MQLQTFLDRLESEPESIQFEDSMAVIEANYDFVPTSFRNGETLNKAGQNNGSCKILAFGQLNGLNVDQTLACFGKFYRDDVLANPNGDDHQNIRNFMHTGWDEVSFHGTALMPK